MAEMPPMGGGAPFGKGAGMSGLFGLQTRSLLVDLFILNKYVVCYVDCFDH